GDLCGLPGLLLLVLHCAASSRPFRCEGRAWACIVVLLHRRPRGHLGADLTRSGDGRARRTPCGRASMARARGASGEKDPRFGFPLIDGRGGQREPSHASYTPHLSMKTEIKLDIQAQPDDQTCGPTCLHALYRHWGLSDASLKQVISEVERLRSGGTIAELLACDALRRGFAATIYTYHLQLFDPTWFAADGIAHDR